jgi:uncharacterized glyoxalase superfamily protein PhnB
VTPHIVVRDAARAADWYERALGAHVGSRLLVRRVAALFAPAAS